MPVLVISWLQDFSVTVKRRGRSELLESPDRTQMAKFGKIIHKRPTYAKKSRIPVGPTAGNDNEVCPNINADAFTPIGVLKNMGARVIYDGISEDLLDEF